MKEKPILFSEPMVRAIRAGNKTMTRRVVKPDKPVSFNVGDILWVRETWRAAGGNPSEKMYEYKADGGEAADRGVWKPSIHMPRAAARIFLEVISVRFEVLHEITLGDSIREGFILRERWAEWSSPDIKIVEMKNKWALERVWRQWDEIYGGGIFKWDNNPIVAVIEFRTVAYE